MWDVGEGATTYHAENIPRNEKRISPANAPAVRVLIGQRRQSTSGIREGAITAVRDNKKGCSAANSQVVHVLVPALARMSR